MTVGDWWVGGLVDFWLGCQSNPADTNHQHVSSHEMGRQVVRTINKAFQDSHSGLSERAR